MSNRRSDLAEMSALYLIPIVAVVITASSGGMIAGALKPSNGKLWTLVVSYVCWGFGAPFSWMILTMYLIRLTVHEQPRREIIVSLLLPVGPLSLAGFS